MILVISVRLSAEDYQYQYFANEKDKDGKTPFSDYIPKVKMHYKTVPHYLEDFYELYGLKQYYNENSLRKNIERMKIALTCKFRHPSESLAKTDSEKEYQKYRHMMFMHINMLLLRDHLTIAGLYDKHQMKYYNLDFAKDISESIEIAEKFYRDAIPYWKEAVKHAKAASRIKITTDLGYMENERYRIISGDLDYDKIINGFLRKTAQKKQKLSNAVASAKNREQQ